MSVRHPLSYVFEILMAHTEETPGANGFTCKPCFHPERSAQESSHYEAVDDGKPGMPARRTQRVPRGRLS